MIRRIHPPSVTLTRSAAVAFLALAGCAPQTPTRESVGATAHRATDTVRAAPTPDAAGIEVVPVTAAALVDSMRAAGGRAVLLNVWASWCAPCREEFPDLIELERRYRDRGFRLMFVSADDPEGVPGARAFLARHGVTGRTYLKNQDDMTFIDTLSPKWSGALPACFVYDHTGRLHMSWEGRVAIEVMERRILEALGTTAAAPL